MHAPRSTPISPIINEYHLDSIRPFLRGLVKACYYTYFASSCNEIRSYCGMIHAHASCRVCSHHLLEKGSFLLLGDTTQPPQLAAHFALSALCSASGHRLMCLSERRVPSHDPGRSETTRRARNKGRRSSEQRWDTRIEGVDHAGR